MKEYKVIDEALSNNNPVQNVPLEQFLDSGLLPMVNEFLHIFGFALDYEMTAEGVPIGNTLFPVRTTLRGFSDKGFSEASQEKSYAKITRYMKEHADDLQKDLNMNNNIKQIDLKDKNNLFTIGRPKVKDGVKGKEYISKDHKMLAFKTEEAAKKYLKGFGYNEERIKEEGITFEKWPMGFIGDYEHIIVEEENTRGTNFDDLYNDPNFISPEERERIEAEVQRILHEKGLDK